MSISQGYIFGATELVTNTKLGLLVNDASLNVTEAELDVSSDPQTNYIMRWDGSKMDWISQQSLASVSTAAVPSLTSIMYAQGIQFIIDGGGDIITTGVKGDVQVPFACKISRADLFANEAGSITLDIWKDTYANFPPTAADIITVPSLSAIASNKGQELTLASWAISLAMGDILRYNVGCCASITRAAVSLWVTK